jgi:glutathione S-transferase
MTHSLKLVIGSKNVSSWSLRPWILMRQLGIPFEEILISLDRPGTREELAKHSPSGKVPVLIDGDVKIWESMAILEYLNEKFPGRGILPDDDRERVWARCICAEMHSGFSELRKHFPFQIGRSPNAPALIPPAVKKDLDRITNIWKECLEYSGGPFLFGEYSMADAMYTPVVLGRIVPYGIPVDGKAAEYCKHILSMPALKNWIQ